MVQDDVLRVRRSRVKLAPWLLLSVVFAAGFVRYFIPLGVGAKIIGIIGAVFFSWGAVKLSFELLVPRDVMVIGREGIYQRAVRPHVLIRWREIADIGVIERGSRVRTVGVVVRNPAQFRNRGPLGRLLSHRWVPWLLKLLLGVSVVLYEGGAGVSDAIKTLGGDMSSHATFEISTLGFPMSAEELVDLLHARWRKIVGPPRHRPRRRHR